MTEKEIDIIRDMHEDAVYRKSKLIDTNAPYQAFQCVINRIETLIELCEKLDVNLNSRRDR